MNGHPRPRFYILARRRVLAATALEWARWFETEGADRARQVALTSIRADVCVSTVFIGMEYPSDVLAQREHPRLFEARVLGGVYDGELRRVETWDEAEQAHAELVALARDGGPS